MAKIHLFTNYFPPETGAAAFRLSDMVKGLTTANHKVEVFTAMPNYPKGKIFEKYRGKWFFKETQENITIRRYWIYASHSAKKLPRFLNMFSLAFSTLYSFFYILKAKPDIIIVQYPPVALPLLGLLFAKLTKAKFIVNVSDIWPSAIADLGVMKKGFFYKILDNIETFLYQNATLCLGQSEEILQHIHSKSKSPTLLYRTSADCELFSQKQDYQLENNKLKIIYAGVMGIAHSLLQLCKNIDFSTLNAELHIYGDGFEKLQIAAFLTQNPNRGIYLHSIIPFQEMPQLLQQHDAALISQKTKVFGTVPSKMYEALAIGLPVLFNGLGEGATIIREQKAGYISNPNNYNELIENIETLKNTTIAAREKVGNNGRNAALQFFNRKDFVLRLVKKITEIE